ncbi:hypothetical protein HY972_01675 [Candidatus Kaiserbacteria bacterium]|nr:hypothetical protein [Candidatus Kaiserbacteria bacterium]
MVIGSPVCIRRRDTAAQEIATGKAPESAANRQNEWEEKVMTAKHYIAYGFVALFVALCELPAFVFDTLFGTKGKTGGDEPHEK